VTSSMLRLDSTVIALGLLIAVPCVAKEAVYLKTGFSLEADSHIQRDQSLIFRVGMGTLEFAADQVMRIETVPETPLGSANRLFSGESKNPEEILNYAAQNQGLDQDFVRSVAKVESGLHQETVSRKGAMGLMQLMPSTAAGLGVNAAQMADNARGGAKYLRYLLIRYHGNSALALAAYNAGPDAVAKFGGVPPYPETQRYVLMVLREYERELKTKTKLNSRLSTANRTSATK
jgi:soluble lytic murein transglycosylase-like protein